MKPRPRFAPGLALGFALASSASCASSPPMTSTTIAQSAQQTRAPQPATTRPEMADPFFDVDLAGVSIEPQQRQKLEAIRASLRAATAPVRDEQRLLLMRLAEGVDAGGVHSSVEAQLRQVVSLAKQGKAAIAVALQDLHALLTPEQRARVRGTFSIGLEAMSPRVLPNDGLGPLPMVASSIGLSTEQLRSAQGRLMAARQEPPLPTREDHARHRAMMQAFHGPTFDANALGAGEGFARAARASAVRTAQIVDALAPELNPQQRARLAELLRRKAQPPAKAETQP